MLAVLRLGAKKALNGGRKICAGRRDLGDEDFRWVERLGGGCEDLN